MSKNYVPKTLGEFISESKSIPLKRKYGERPAISAGTNAPLRNQVLCYVAESGTVSKLDLKRFIVGLKEGGATPAAANMFIKRNARYFITESKNGITYFKLSNLGKRLVNQFIPAENMNVSESVKDARSKFSSILENTSQNRKVNERYVEDEQIDGRLEPENLEDENDIEADDVNDMDDMDDINMERMRGENGEDELEGDDEGAAKEIEYDEDNDQDLDNDEDDDLESKVGELEEKVAELEAALEELQGGENLEDEEDIEGEDLEDDNSDLEDEDVEVELEDEDELKDESEDELEDDKNVDEDVDRPKDKPRKFDFKSRHGEPGLNDMDESLTEERKEKLEQIIENIKSKRKKVNEATEASPNDELKDEDLDDLSLDDETPTEETPEEGNEEVEKVEITEFIITVDNVDEAIKELEELGVTAERVPVEPKAEEVPPEVPEEEPVAEEPTAEAPTETPTPEAAKESLQAFIRDNYINEDDKETPEEEAGASDELGLGDQGADATELTDEQPGEEELTEPTTEFEENKIKVKAEDWDILKGWLEEKGVDVAEMFGGEIETEDVDLNAEASDVDGEGSSEEISDEDIDFSGISDDTKEKVNMKNDNSKK